MKWRKGWRMSCDVGEVSMTYVKQRNGYITSCDVRKAAKGLENELWRRWSYVRVGEWDSALFSNPSSLHLFHSSYSSPLPTSQLVLQPFRCFTYAIGTSHSSPGEPPMPFDDVSYVHDDSVICYDYGPQDYMKNANWPSNSKGWRPLP